MLNFTVGPVQSSECVRAIGAENVPYFRTPEFSNLMLENERMILDFANAPEGSRAIFLTGSGTAAMEAAVMNALTRADKALVVNGGSFGTRFVQLLQRHDIPYDEIKLERGQPLREEDLARYEGGDYTTFLINACETSTGVKYDMDIVAQVRKDVKEKVVWYKEQDEGHYDFWENHLKYVYDEAVKLAEKYKADLEIVKLGALLHDIALVSKVGTKADHHENGKKIADEIPYMGVLLKKNQDIETAQAYRFRR